MKGIILFGPFIGTLSWEFYRFAPFSTYIKKNYPECKIAVLTRPERFDLYGHADYLIPLRIKDDDVKNQIFFKLKDFEISKYNKLITQFNKMYSRRYNIVDHYYPDIIDYRYKVRWQFGRNKMNYNFNPRLLNKSTIKKIFPKKIFIFVSPPYDSDFISKLTNFVLKNKLNKKFVFVTYGDCGQTAIYKNIKDIEINSGTSHLGYLIEILKRSRLVIGPKSDFTHLSLLLKVPVIMWGNDTNIDLINPLDTRIVLYSDIPDNIEDKILKELGKKKSGEDYNQI